MHLVKWTRKNMQKIMVFVIIFCMVSFVIGSVGLQMVVSLFGGGNRLIATFGDGQKIKSQDYIQAQNDLRVLQTLMVDRILMGQSGGLTGPLLTHLLFPGSALSGDIGGQLKQAVQRGQLPISQAELDDFFQKQPEQPEILWLLLKAEAYQAGCAVSNESAAQTLSFAIPQLTGNQLDAGTLVSGIISNSNITQEQILKTFADMMSITTYIQNVLDNQAVTINQIKATLGRSRERIDAEFVEIQAQPLIDEDTSISNEQIQAQFDKYKTLTPNDPAEENPFGFGYKLPKRVQLEYMIVSMDDVTELIEKPAAEAVEEYYARNIDTFRTSKPSDPNNPESEPIVETRPFAEAEAQIRRMLETEQTTARANILFNEIKDKTEAGFETLNFEEASVAELQKAAGDFEAIGKELSEKNSVKISVGKTGWLDAAAFGQDRILSSMGVRRGQNYLRLNDMAFAAAEVRPQRQRIGVPSVRVWETIGPFNGSYYSQEDNTFSRLMALVRVIGIEEETVAENANTTYDTSGVVLGEKDAETGATFSVIEKVKDDIRLAAAMDAAKGRADELATLIGSDGWDDALAAYNEKYAAADPNETDDQRIKLANINQKLRMSETQIAQARIIMRENRAMAQYVRQQITDNLLTTRLYEMLDEAAETTGTIQTVLPFQPQATCYVVKEVVRQPATMVDYMGNKTQTALQLGAADAATLTLVHLNPENILERMTFELQIQQPSDEAADDAADADTETESEAN